jgi:hypothetical protein
MKEADMQAAAYEAACRSKSSVYSLYWYKSTNTDCMKEADMQAAAYAAACRRMRVSLLDLLVQKYKY